VKDDLQVVAFPRDMYFVVPKIQGQERQSILLVVVVDKIFSVRFLGLVFHWSGDDEAVEVLSDADSLIEEDGIG
jgi:hypothetical protein